MNTGCSRFLVDAGGNMEKAQETFCRKSLPHSCPRSRSGNGFGTRDWPGPRQHGCLPARVLEAAKRMSISFHEPLVLKPAAHARPCARRRPLPRRAVLRGIQQGAPAKRPGRYAVRLRLGAEKGRSRCQLIPFGPPPYPVAKKLGKRLLGE